MKGPAAGHRALTEKGTPWGASRVAARKKKKEESGRRQGSDVERVWDLGRVGPEARIQKSNGGASPCEMGGK